MFEALTMSSKKIYPFPRDRFIEEVTAANLITGDALATAIGLTVGISQNSTAGWLKFSLDDKEILIAKRPFRYQLSWDSLNNIGAVLGTKTVVIGGITYKVRCLKGAEANPSSWTVGQGQSNPPIVQYSEWNRSICRISANNPGPGTSLGNYSNTDLGAGNSGTGQVSICQETLAFDTTQAIGRGYASVGQLNYFVKANGVGNTNFNHYGWRPVLEAV